MEYKRFLVRAGLKTLSLNWPCEPATVIAVLPPRRG